MMFDTNGQLYKGGLKVGQVWVKGRTEREILFFDREIMVYRGKTDIKNGTATTVSRNVFRRWLLGGSDRAKLKHIPSIECPTCKDLVYLKGHLNKCSCGAVMKVLRK